MPEAAPKFQWGQRVVALADLVNDGSFPGEAEGALLAAQGQAGEVVQVGRHVEARIDVYLVDFDGRAVGCLEHEIALAASAGPRAGPEVV